MTPEDLTRLIANLGSAENELREPLHCGICTGAILGDPYASFAIVYPDKVGETDPVCSKDCALSLLSMSIKRFAGF